MLRLVVVLACAGCLFVTVAATGRSRAVVRSTASNKRAAVRDAKALLAGVVPPAGAVLQSSGTGIGPHANLLTSALASAVAYSTWTVPDDPASVLSFVEAHLPPGSKVASTGSGGPNPISHWVIRSWPPIAGVLDIRWLQLGVTSRAAGGTLLYAKSQSQWVLTRPLGEHIPSGVREVDVTSGWPGKPPFASRRVTNGAQVRKIVALFDSLETVQPGAMSCPSYSTRPVVVVGFRRGPTHRLVAEASVSSVASFRWPASVPGWACFPVSFSVFGHREKPLVGNVITPIHRLLHIRLAAHG